MADKAWPPNYLNGPMIRIGDPVEAQGYELAGMEDFALVWGDYLKPARGIVEAIEGNGARVVTERGDRYLCPFDQLVKINLPTTVTLPPLMGERFLRCVDRCMSEWLGETADTRVLVEVADLVRAAMEGRSDDAGSA